MSRWHQGLALLLAIVGFLLIAQIRAGRELKTKVELPSLRVGELAILIQKQKEAQRILEEEIRELQKRLESYQEAIAKGRGLTQDLTEEIEHYRVVLGLTPVRGPGAVVVLQEGRSLPLELVKTTVQASDLSGLVNELWSAGAEAVAINGFRILATTGFSQEGFTIVAGPYRLKPPYVIEAIGDPKGLIGQLNLPGSFVDGLRSVGFIVTITEKKEIRLPPYRSSIPQRLVRPSP